VTLLAFDTATAATAVAVARDDGAVLEARHDPRPGERPVHATRLLALVEAVLGQAGGRLEHVDRIAVGTGPGSFTGLRIGIATARALAQAGPADLVGVSTLRTLAAGAGERAADAPVLALLDARRGEAFAAAWRGDRELMPAATLAPSELGRCVARLGAGVLAVGEGALRFRAQIEPVGAAVPPDDDPLHRVSARPMCRLAADMEAGEPEAVLPEYLRLPDAEIARRRPKWPPPTS
jgi:tRNA threonylcarbamoyladenosine biosynthesis protein TsaB